MVDRTRFDWQRIEFEYRANRLSNREISKRYGPTEGAIRLKAKKEGWKKNLAHRVKERTEELLVRRQLRTPYARDVPDEEMTEDIANRSADIVQSHRRDINQARTLAAVLMGELQSQTNMRDLLAEFVKEEAEEAGWSVKRQMMVERAISLQGRVQCLEGLSRAMKTLQTLERQAFGIDGKESDRDPLDELLDEVSDTSRGIDGYNIH